MKLLFCIFIFSFSLFSKDLTKAEILSILKKSRYEIETLRPSEQETIEALTQGSQKLREDKDFQARLAYLYMEYFQYSQAERNQLGLSKPLNIASNIIFSIIPSHPHILDILCGLAPENPRTVVGQYDRLPLNLIFKIIENNPDKYYPNIYKALAFEVKFLMFQASTEKHTKLLQKVFDFLSTTPGSALEALEGIRRLHTEPEFAKRFASYGFTIASKLFPGADSEVDFIRRTLTPPSQSSLLQSWYALTLIEKSHLESPHAEEFIELVSNYLNSEAPLNSDFHFSEKDFTLSQFHSAILRVFNKASKLGKISTKAQNALAQFGKTTYIDNEQRLILLSKTLPTENSNVLTALAKLSLDTQLGEKVKTFLPQEKQNKISRFFAGIRYFCLETLSLR